MDETYPTPPPLCGSDALLLDFDGPLVALAPRCARCARAAVATREIEL